MTYQDRIGEALLDKQARSGQAISFMLHNGRRVPIIRGGMPISDSLPARLAEWAGTGTTYYVDDSIGSDSNTETQAKSESTPWKTIQKAVDTYVKPATGHVRILVKAGTYRKAGGTNATNATVNFFNQGSRAGDATHTIIIENYPGHSPTIQEATYTGGSPSTSERHALWFDDSNAKFIRIRGFTITPNAAIGLNQAQGFRIDGTTADIEIDDCHIHGWKLTGSLGTQPRAQGIFIENGSNRVQIYNCVINNNGDSATGFANLEHGIYLGGSTHTIVNCLVYDNRNGFGVQFYEGGGGGSGHIVSHLVTSNNKKSGMVVDGSYTVTVRNTIFYDNDEWALSGRGGATVNVQYCISNANGLAGNLGSGYDNNSGASTVTLANNLTSSPSFVNFGSRDFHLNSSSPAYNAGLIEYSPPKDIDGTTRVTSTLGVYAAPEEVGGITTDSGTLYLDLQPSGTEFQTGQTTDAGTLLFKLTPSGSDLHVVYTEPPPSPGPVIPVLNKTFREFRIIHVNHAYEEIGEVFPSSMSFSLPLSAVGDVSYEMSLNDVMATEEKVYPYKTDYILMLGNKRLQAGIHTGVAISDIEQEALQVSGNDYLHYLELRWLPFDPMNLAAGGYIAPIGTDIFMLIEALLDLTLAVPDSLVIAYDNGLSGQLINDFKIELGDTESIKAKIETLSKKAPGFDYEIDPFREFKMYADGKGSIRTFTFEQGRNIYLLDYANRGPEATHTLGIVQGQGNKLARAVTHIASSTYRRLDSHEDLQIATTDINVVQQMTEAESQRNIIPRIEFSAKYVGDDAITDIFDEVETGDRVPVYADLGWTVIDDYMRIVNIQGNPDDEGNLELTFTFDNGTLAQ